MVHLVDGTLSTFAILKELVETIDYTTICIMEEFKNETTVASTDRILKEIGKKEADEIMKTKEKQLPSETFITGMLRIAFVSLVGTGANAQF